MTLKEAQKTERYFDGGVKAGVWCYHGHGNWEIVITSSHDGQLCLYDFDSVNRLANGLLEAIRYVQANSKEAGWTIVPQDAAEQLVAEAIDAKGEAVGA